MTDNHKAIAQKLVSIGNIKVLGQPVGVLILQFDKLCLSGIFKNASITEIIESAALVTQQMLVVSGAI